MSDTAAAPPSRWQRVKVWMDRAGMCIWGAGIASLFGIELASRRWPHSRAAVPLALIAIFYVTWDLFRKDRPAAAGEAGAWFLFCVCVIPLYYERHQAWTPPVLAVVSASYFWWIGEKRQRPASVAITGTLLAGAAAPTLHWPPVDQSLLVLVGGGVSTLLQGAWFLLGYVRGTTPPEPLVGPDLEPAPRSGVPRLVMRSFGRIENQQIISPVVESHLARRHQFRIEELSNLGFSYYGCYSESFPANRLFFGFPAIVTLLMIAHREFIRIRGGRVHSYYRLMLSRNGETYADLSARGVKFYTPFSGGACLITAQYSGPDYDQPPVTKRFLKAASILDAWGTHCAAVESRESAGGLQAIRHASFTKFSEILDLERAADA